MLVHCRQIDSPIGIVIGLYIYIFVYIYIYFYIYVIHKSCFTLVWSKPSYEQHIYTFELLDCTFMVNLCTDLYMFCCICMYTAVVAGFFFINNCFVLHLFYVKILWSTQVFHSPFTIWCDNMNDLINQAGCNLHSGRNPKLPEETHTDAGVHTQRWM